VSLEAFHASPISRQLTAVVDGFAGTDGGVVSTSSVVVVVEVEVVVDVVVGGMVVEVLDVVVGRVVVEVEVVVDVVVGRVVVEVEDVVAGAVLVVVAQLGVAAATQAVVPESLPALSTAEIT
jgi:hypothetical protein